VGRPWPVTETIDRLTVADEIRPVALRVQPIGHKAAAGTGTSSARPGRRPDFEVYSRRWRPGAQLTQRGAQGRSRI